LVEQKLAVSVQVRPAEHRDLILLVRAFPFGPPEKHAERLLRQSLGEVLYLIAWNEGTPVGHGLLKWRGAEEQPIAAYVNGLCPDVEDLFVIEAMRSKGIGRQILSTAECLVRERGYPQIGLSVNVGNERAEMLYKLLGYRDAGLGEHYEHGEYVDKHGKLQTWEERCLYLIKMLDT
jgi:GNAT superfamily N-acetyltransferase